jgi:hypothetical protein
MGKVAVVAAIAGWVILGGLGADVSPAYASVPLPSTLPLLGLGLALLGAARRK